MNEYNIRNPTEMEPQIQTYIFAFSNLHELLPLIHLAKYSKISQIIQNEACQFV